MSSAMARLCVGAACVMRAAGFGVPAQAAETAVVSQPVSGPFSSSVVPCAFALCTEGELGGSLPAIYRFSLDLSAQEPVARSVMTNSSRAVVRE